MKRTRVLVAGVATLGICSLVQPRSIEAAPPAPVATAVTPMTAPTGMLAGKTLGAVPPSVPGAASSMSVLMRYADGLISPSKGTALERALATKLDATPGAKSTAQALVAGYRGAPAAERERVLPGFAVETLVATPINFGTLEKAIQQTSGVINIGQFDRWTLPDISPPTMPPLLYRADLTGVKCNTPPQNGVAPLFMMSAIETGSTDYTFNTKFFPSSGVGAPLAAGAVSTSAAGNLYGGAAGTTSGFGTNSGGVLLVGAVALPASAADAQTQRDRFNLLLTTASVFAGGLSGGRSIENMQRAVSFTLGVMALSGAALPAGSVVTRVISESDYVVSNDLHSATTNGLASKWQLNAAMGANGDYTFFVDAPTTRPPATVPFQVVLSITRPTLTSVPAVTNGSTGHVWFNISLGNSPPRDGDHSTFPTYGQTPGLVAYWQNNPLDRLAHMPATIQVKRRSFNDAPIHVEMKIIARQDQPSQDFRITILRTNSSPGYYCGDFMPTPPIQEIVTNSVGYNGYIWSGRCPPLPGTVTAGDVAVDITPRAPNTNLAFDVAKNGAISGDITGNLGQEFNVCGQTAPTACVVFRVLSTW